MAELAMLADIQRTVYREDVTSQLHVDGYIGRKSLLVIDRHSSHCVTPTTLGALLLISCPTRGKRLS